MYKFTINIVTAVSLLVICRAQSTLRVPARVEGRPNLLDSFIPASMQIMAHLTELMKYDLKPQKPTPGRPTTTTSTTIRPTPTHKPAIYAPEFPPGPDAYFSKGISYEEYVQRLQHPSGNSYFDRYTFPLVEVETDRDSRGFGNAQGLIPKDVQIYLGKGFADTLRLANRIEADFVPKDADVQVQEFSQNYDDSDFRFELLRQKRVPPTRAYVTLLSLYDLMNKESKRLGLNKYQGYADNILKELAEASSGTSAYQLRAVMNKIVQRQEVKKPEILTKIDKLIKDLDQDNSYLNDALRYIPPLAFAL